MRRLGVALKPRPGTPHQFKFKCFPFDHSLNTMKFTFNYILDVRDITTMWVRTVDCIRKAVREVLGISRGNPKGAKKIGGGKERTKKSKTKKVAYTTSIESLDEEEYAHQGCSRF
ncbi:hypothetical protein H5410_062831 [Solanum commersonii]|uniref:Uncharacterized protein n=1 Tax=Solanum commersonii TaxID=4109 RepID=A0A9J5WBQ1_SOLCO|nr:hypothetical protein H5410_062831 [Solanum commersonii]